MKKAAFTLLAVVLLLGTPVALMAEEKETWDKALGRHTEEFGKGFFEYLGGVLMFPVHVTEKAVRTLLFMDHE